MSGNQVMWRGYRTRAIGKTTSGMAGVLRTPAQFATQDKETSPGSGGSTTGSEPAQNGVELWRLGVTGSPAGGKRRPGDRSEQVDAYGIYPAYVGAGDNLAGPA